MSGFFFWGMMDEPVVKPSSSSTKRNSQLLHRISSSEKRDRCIISTAQAERNSTQKSRSDTPSMLLRATEEKPSCWASHTRSMGKVVPASAQHPMGETSMRPAVSSSRPTSRCSIMA